MQNENTPQANIQPEKIPLEERGDLSRVQMYILLAIFSLSILGLSGYIIWNVSQESNNPANNAETTNPPNNLTLTNNTENSVEPTPSSETIDADLSDEEMGGCTNFIVYKGTADQTQYIVVSVDKDELEITEGTRTFDLEENKDDINIVYHIFDPGIEDQTNKHFPFCNDIAPIAESPSYTAVSGTITIEAGPEERDEYMRSYTVSVSLIDMIFEIDSEETILPDTQINNVNVGWLPG